MLTEFGYQHRLCLPASHHVVQRDKHPCRNLKDIGGIRLTLFPIILRLTIYYLSSVDMTAISQMNYCPVGCHCEISRSIDTTYQNIVQLLHSAARDHCPLTTGSFFKSYWDEEMSELKQRSIDTHQLWQVRGPSKVWPNL